MAQTLVQMNAPANIRGRVIGLFSMSGLGMRAFAGVTVGVMDGVIGVHWSLALSALGLLSDDYRVVAVHAAQRGRQTLITLNTNTTLKR